MPILFVYQNYVFDYILSTNGDIFPLGTYNILKDNSRKQINKITKSLINKGFIEG
jgi:hypothetical protein